MARGKSTLGSSRRGPAPGVVHVPASVAGAIAAVVLAALIWAGSDGLRTFDSALVGYATAVVFLAFGVTYRYVVWTQSPPARRYLVEGWRAFGSVRNFARFPALVPRQLVSSLALQTFLRPRGIGRWLAHQSLFWGVIGATAITFPLVFGWIAFVDAPDDRYRLVLFGFETFTFDPYAWWAWLMFHGLDVTAVLVIAGAAFFLWRRFRDREATTGQRLGYDFVPLIALVAISVTGLLLTFSSLLLDGAGYGFLTVLHMACVVLSLVFIPFGKFFHVIQRPASVGVEVYKVTTLERDGAHACRRCGEPLEGAAFVRDLERTMDELELGFSGWVETCPRCKRLERGAAYLREVKRGFS